MLLAGDCYYDQQRYDETLKWYLKAYNLGERGRNLAWNIAYIYDIKGNTGSAIPFYKETLDYDTTLVDIYRRLGELVPGEDGNYYRTRESQLRQNK
jgi:tetratricopeptide (TPR) repeat protein